MQKWLKITPFDAAQSAAARSRQRRPTARGRPMARVDLHSRVDRLSPPLGRTCAVDARRDATTTARHSAPDVGGVGLHSAVHVSYSIVPDKEESRFAFCNAPHSLDRHCYDDRPSPPEKGECGIGLQGNMGYFRVKDGLWCERQCTNTTTSVIVSNAEVLGEL